LCDFGLSRILEDASLWNTSATSVHGTVRWMAPELLSGTQQTVSIQSDMYAYGMTCFEAYTGLLPFHQYKSDGKVITAVLVEKRIPERISAYNINEQLWNLWIRCWDRVPRNRPAATDALSFMAKIDSSQFVEGTESNRDWLTEVMASINSISFH